MATISLRPKMDKLLNKIWSRLKQGIKSQEVKSFKESQKRQSAFDSRNLGVRTVPLDKIVGSVGRYHDFDNKFRLKEYLPHERLEGVKKVMREGKPIAPIQLYQIKDEYYVLDGNHRVSAAKEFGQSEIAANIVEFIPSQDTLENILYREKSEFREKTGLTQTIDLTEVGQYAYLLKQIARHQRALETKAERPVPFQSASTDWADTIYKPLVGIIKKARLIQAFPERTLADLYAYISSYQWEKGAARKYGSGIDQLISSDMEAFRKKMANKNELEYPEMLRKMTAFVLMRVSAKKEERVIERLHSLKGVREIHSVHGDADMLIKIVLTRDLVSSDAEIIGNFVHNEIRQIPGIISTQTLIPGFSKIKEDGEK